MAIFSRLTLVCIAALISGCANMQQMQAGMDEIDSFWGGINQKTLAQKGARHYEKSLSQCKEASIKAAQSLGFDVTEIGLTSISARAITPMPFTASEFAEIKAVEEPMMQAVAANHVGKFTSNFFYLESGKNYVIANVYFVEGSKESTVSVDFKLEPIGNTYGLIYGKNPPPEDVKKGVDKWWAAFEAALN